MWITVFINPSFFLYIHKKMKIPDEITLPKKSIVDFSITIQIRGQRRRYKRCDHIHYEC